jgi:hypothetical protein
VLPVAVVVRLYTSDTSKSIRKKVTASNYAELRTELKKAYQIQQMDQLRILFVTDPTDIETRAVVSDDNSFRNYLQLGEQLPDLLISTAATPPASQQPAAADSATTDTSKPSRTPSVGLVLLSSHSRNQLVSASLCRFCRNS